MLKKAINFGMPWEEEGHGAIEAGGQQQVVVFVGVNCLESEGQHTLERFFIGLHLQTGFVQHKLVFFVR